MEQTAVLGGRYRLEEKLARGGMADVYSARDESLGRTVAVKILHPQFANDQAFVTRFRREAQAAAGLTHPNIVSIYDSGQDGETYYMVMELIDGQTLRDIRKTQGPLFPRRAAEIAAEAAAALAVAHRAGVYHRDVKPGNIMLTDDGSVKVTDFGIARALDDSEELTRTGAVIGTAAYFSPEQAQGLPADERSDVYSLGVVLYEMATGKPPFTGESPVSVAYQHVSEMAPPPSSVNHDVPAHLEAIIERAMEKNPEDRYQTAEDMRSDLLRFLAGEAPATTEPSPDAETMLLGHAPPPATVPPDETARRVAYVEPSRQTNPGYYLAGIVGLLLLLAAAIFLVNRLGATPEVEMVTIPPLAGLQPNEAFEELGNLDLKVRQRDESSTTVEEGVVIGTDPVAGVSVEVGSVVWVIVSTGPQRFSVPNVMNETEENARAILEDQLLRVGQVTFVFSDTVPAGSVVDQDPRPGIFVLPDSEVNLEISQGPAVLTMPSVVNLAAEVAIRELTNAGFVNIETTEDFSDELLAGFVISTDPEAGELAAREQTVTIVVSKGPAPIPVPDLTGRTLADARATIEELGLIFEQDPTTVPVTVTSGLDGLVAAQDPAPGVELERGDVVTVRLGEVPLVVVPDLTDLTENQAANTLSALGLVLAIDSFLEVDSAQVGLVVAQEPTAGTQVAPGSIIGVTLGIAAPVTTTTTTTSTTTTTTTAP